MSKQYVLPCARPTVFSFVSPCNEKPFGGLSYPLVSDTELINRKTKELILAHRHAGLAAAPAGQLRSLERRSVQVANSVNVEVLVSPLFGYRRR